MSDQHVPALRRRFLEDMRIKGLQPKMQTMYLRAMRDFTRFLGRSPDTATPEDLRAFQLDMSRKCTGSATFNNRLSVLGFCFSVILCAYFERRARRPKERATSDWLPLPCN